MNINRNNYEEYFLLYADNELSGQEKNIVEAFVKQHADLKEEFLLIRQSVIKPDSGVKLENKNFLFKETDKFINKYNYLEIFVLYNDDELSQSEKQETEAFLLQNPSLRSEFELLQKTKFQPDINIVFPGKKILFKKEQDEKIIPLKWWKLAAAAVLFGSGIFIGVELLQKDNKNVPVAVKNTTPKKLNKINLIIPDIKRAETVIADTARIDKESTTNTDTPQQMVLEKGKKETPYIKKAAEMNNPKAAKTPEQRSDVRGNEDLAANNKKEQDAVVEEVQRQKDIKLIKMTDDRDTSVYTVSELDNIEKAEVSEAFKASFTTDDNTDRNNYAFYNITEEKFNKSKVGGFLRKVKRIIERKSPFYKVKDKSEIAVK